MILIFEIRVVDHIKFYGEMDGCMNILCACSRILEHIQVLNSCQINYQVYFTSEL